MKSLLTNDEIENICTLYKSGLSSIKISKIYKRSPQGIRYILGKNKVILRENCDAGRKYSLNENYFTIIDTIDKAYFLGLLFADGCNTGRGVKLDLQVKDKEIIEKFVKYINYGGVIYSTKRKSGYLDNCEMSSLVISSKKISHDLTDHGCIERKTNFCDFPNIDKIFYNHFIRGVFDGDGGVYIDKRNQKRIHFTGNDILIEKINDIISKNCLVKKSKIYFYKKCKKNIISITFSGNKNCEKIKNFLYKNCGDIFLSRKRDKLNVKFESPLIKI
jgi:hypothetical protein